MDVKKPKKWKKRKSLIVQKRDHHSYKRKKETQDAGPSQREFIDTPENEVAAKETNLPEIQPFIDDENPANCTRMDVEKPKKKRRKKNSLIVQKRDHHSYKRKKETQDAGPSQREFIDTPENEVAAKETNLPEIQPFIDDENPANCTRMDVEKPKKKRRKKNSLIVQKRDHHSYKRKKETQDAGPSQREFIDTPENEVAAKETNLPEIQPFIDDENPANCTRMDVEKPKKKRRKKNSLIVQKRDHHSYKRKKETQDAGPSQREFIDTPENEVAAKETNLPEIQPFIDDENPANCTRMDVEKPKKKRRKKNSLIVQKRDHHSYKRKKETQDAGPSQREFIDTPENEVAAKETNLPEIQPFIDDENPANCTRMDVEKPKKKRRKKNSLIVQKRDHHSYKRKKETQDAGPSQREFIDTPENEVAAKETNLPEIQPFIDDENPANCTRMDVEKPKKKRRKKNSLIVQKRDHHSYKRKKETQDAGPSQREFIDTPENEVAAKETNLPEIQPFIDDENPANCTRMDVEKPKKKRRKKNSLIVQKRDHHSYKRKKETQDAGPSQRVKVMDMKKPKKRKKRPLTLRKQGQTSYKLKKKNQDAGLSQRDLIDSSDDEIADKKAYLPDRQHTKDNEKLNSASYVMTPGINLLDECDTNEYATTNDDTKYDITNDDTIYDNTNDDTKDDITKDDMIKNDNIKDEPSSFEENNYYTTNYGSSSWVIDDHSYCAPDTEYIIKVEAGASQPYGPEFATEYCEVEDLQSQPYDPEFPPDYCKVEDVRSQPCGSEFPPDYSKVGDVQSQLYVPEFPPDYCKVEDGRSQPYDPEFPPDYCKVEDVRSQPYDPEFPPDYCKVEDVSSQPYGPADFPSEDYNVEDVRSQPYGPEFPSEHCNLEDVQLQQYVPEFSPDNSKGENVPSQLHGPEFTPDFCKVVEVSSEPYDPAFPVEDCNVEDVPLQEYGPEFPTEYRELRDAIQMDSCPGQYEVMRKSAMIKFIEHYEGEPVIGKISVMVSPDYLVKIRVHGQEIQSNHNIWEHFPRYTSTKEAIFKVLLELSQLNVCCGNPETEFTKHIPPRVGLGESTDRDNQEYIAYLETGFHTNCIRSKKCDLLIRNTLGSRALRCRWCQMYRSTLRKRKWREENKPYTPSKFTNNQKLSHIDLVKKASKPHTEKTILKREVEILKKKLEKVKRQAKGENISELLQLTEDSGNEINEKLDPDS
ncbi:unnamed protein product [Owenia fusiformis]|uniref:Uncharacterized protein n=1 Tax=Owenia fusiformis TaxID=6347 RepID=A0A8S4NJ35_OWEFU|nr:unnamed protein product [Owenia fusiformis]